MGFAAFASGCFPKPNKANIELRKQVQSLESTIDDLQRQRTVDAAQMAAIESGRAVETLPADRLAKLFTTSGVKFKSIAIGEDLDPDAPGDEGFKIGVTLVDDAGDEYKAAGSFVIELFDLATDRVRLGTWSLSTDEARPKWLSTLVFDGYVFSFPWQTPPANARLTVKATFTDELTGRVFSAERPITVNPPPATQPVASEAE